MQVTSKHKMIYDNIFHKVHVPFDVNQLKSVPEVTMREFSEIKIKHKMFLMYT